MKRIVSILLSASFILSVSMSANAQSLPVPPQLQQLATIKTRATTSLNTILQPVQRQQIIAIGKRTEQELDRSLGTVNAANGPIAKVFTTQQLLALADALRSGQMPAVREDQMASLAYYMSDIVLKEGPTWQKGSSQVDALLTAHQRDEIGALRAATLRKLPHLSLMGFDVFGALTDGTPLGGFFSDAGSFALLLLLPNLKRVSVLRRQSPIP